MPAKRTTPNVSLGRVLRGCLLTGLALGAVAVGLDSSHSVDSSFASTHPQTASSPTTHRHDPHSPPPGAEIGAGNLGVYVPPVPPKPVIAHLCADLVNGSRPEPRSWLPDLVAITGGTTGATTSWCRTYLALSSTRPSGRQ